MSDRKKFLGIITARSGSKGLKNKNLLKMNNYPLIYWPIKTFRNSKYINHFILSTDSKKIAKVSKKYNCLVPFIRPKILSRDKSSSIDVIIHAINFYKKKNINFEYVALLEPTSPLTDSRDLDRAISRLLKLKKKADSVVGISKNINHHPDFNIKLKQNNFITNISNKKNSIRQSLSNLYFFDGSLYVSKVKSILKKKTFYHKKTIGYEMPKWKSFEIDDYIDFLCVSKIFKYKNKL